MSSFSRVRPVSCRCRRNAARFSFSFFASSSLSCCFRSSSALFTGAIRTSRFAPPRLRNRLCHLAPVLGLGTLNPGAGSGALLGLPPNASDVSPDSPPYSSSRGLNPPPVVFFLPTTPGENTPASATRAAFPAPAAFDSAPSPSPAFSAVAPTPRLDLRAAISFGTFALYLGPRVSSTNSCSACMPVGCSKKLSGLTIFARCFAAFFVRFLSASEDRSE